MNGDGSMTQQPRYRRKTPTFDTTFAVPAEAVIHAMDAAGDDVPYQKPEVPLALSGVGMVREHVPLRIRDPFGSSSPVTVHATLQLLTEVPEDKRGIHTSRIGSLLADSLGEVHGSAQEYVRTLAGLLNETGYGRSSRVSMRGTLSYLEEVQGWRDEKDKTSLEHLELSATAAIRDGQWSESVGFAVNHITACPCVQQTYKHALRQSKGDSSSALDSLGPLLTHSQRCFSRLEVRNLSEDLRILPLFEAVDAVVYRVQNTLPREYELHLVYRAHRHPQFIEDAARQMIAAVGRCLGNEHGDSHIYLNSTSIESIHDFDIVSEFEVPLAQVRKVLR